METPRLILRPWLETDAETLYKYASDPQVGTPAGWPPHTSVENSLEIIRTVFSAPETYAVVLKETGEPIGCCGLVPPEIFHSKAIADIDAEIGYWLAREYWGNGIIPEAVNVMIDHARNKLKKSTLWIAFYDGNDKSKRVAEKCGFTFHHSELNGSVTEHFYSLKA